VSTWCKLDFSPLETVGESLKQVKILSGCWNLLVATVENQLFLSIIPTRKIQAMFSRIMGVLWCKLVYSTNVLMPPATLGLHLEGMLRFGF
jgi:hypothetical protein